MKKYNVELSYNIRVECGNEEQAEELAIEKFDNDCPSTEDFNFKITEEV